MSATLKTGAETRTLIYDETQEFPGDFVSIINTGYDRSGQVSVVDTGKKETIYLSTFGPKVLAGTKGISEDTLRDRCIRIVMHRSCEVEEFKHGKHGKKMEKLKNEITAFVTQHGDDIQKEYLKLKPTKKIHGRNYQLFSGLFSVARVIDKVFCLDTNALPALKSLASERAGQLAEEILVKKQRLPDSCQYLLLYNQ